MTIIDFATVFQIILPHYINEPGGFGGSSHSQTSKIMNIFHRYYERTGDIPDGATINKYLKRKKSVKEEIRAFYTSSDDKLVLRKDVCDHLFGN